MSLKAPSRSKALKFLLRPQPIGVTETAMENVESLGSWLHRLAQENGLDNPLRHAFGRRFHAPMRIENHLTNSTYLADLIRATGRTTDELQMMAFSPPISTVPQRRPFNLAPWLLSDKAHTTRHVVCPTCVNEDPMPYWRKSWRLSVIVDCPVHGTPMAEQCDKCNRRFSLYGKAEYSLNCCTWCGTPIQGTTSETKVKPAPSIWRDFFYSLPYKGQPPEIKPVFDDLVAAMQVFNLLLNYVQAADIGNCWFHCHAGPPLASSSLSEVKKFSGATVDERRQVLKFVAAVMARSGDDFHELVRRDKIHRLTLEMLSFIASTHSGKSQLDERRIA